MPRYSALSTAKQRLIVFDLDGTLVDSRRDLAESMNDLIVERGGAPLPEAAIGRMVGDGAAVLVMRARTRLPFRSVNLAVTAAPGEFTHTLTNMSDSGGPTLGFAL